MNRIYLDNAATTPLAKEVQRAMLEAMAHLHGNPSSIHAEGRQSRAAIEEARKQVAETIGASIGEVFFTSGGTESNNMALKCAVRDLGVRRIISSPIEHHCVLHSIEALERDAGVQHAQVHLNQYGQPDLEHLADLLQQKDTPTLISLMHSNNEIGTLIDLEATAALCAEHGAFFHSDTVQTMGYYPIDVSRTNISFLSGSAHKFHGPKGVGFLYVNSDNIIKPFLDGGSQERNMRGGTENLYGIIGLATALQSARENMDSRREHIVALKQHTLTQLQQHFPEAIINGHLENSHYKVLSVSFPASDRSSLLLFNLDIAGISVSGGSACSSGVNTGSHVIRALHGDNTPTTIRFSFSHYNRKEEIDILMEKLKEVLAVPA